MTVAWDNAVMDDDGSMLILLGALGLSIIIGLAVAIRFASAEMSDDREIDHDSLDDGRVERFDEMMDEEDEEDS